MRIAAVSDCHGKLHLASMPEADILIIAGDYCPDWRGGEVKAARLQLEWVRDTFNPFLKGLPYKKIIVVSGNHDWLHFCEETRNTARYALSAATYLQDESYEFEGIKFYGAPWQAWNHDWAFNLPKTDSEKGYPVAKKIWSQIPTGLDVLITHGPPFGIMDQNPFDRSVGCPILRDRCLQVSPKLHIFGHTHEGYGLEKYQDVTLANVAFCNRDGHSFNPIQVLEV